MKKRQLEPYRKSTNGYIEPKLMHYGHDMTKKWYVEYSLPDQDGKPKRLRIVNFNRYKNLADRLAAAEDALRTAQHLVRTKAVYSQNRTAEENEIMIGLFDPKKATIWEALQYAKEIKFRKRISNKTKKDYNAHLSVFEVFLLKSGLKKQRFTEFRSDHLYRFFDWLETKKEVSPKTFNNYRTNIAALYAVICKRHREIINIVHDIERKDVALSKSHVMYTQEEVHFIDQYLRQANPQLLLFIYHIFYLFMRPGEVLRVQRKHLQEEVLEVPYVENTKIRRTNFRQVPEIMRQLYSDLRIYDLKDDDYIFKSPGTNRNRPVGINYFYKEHKKMMKILGLDRPGLTLYGYKHTGNVRLWNLFRDIQLNQLQNNHDSPETTKIYLREVGIIVENRLRDFV
jgi:integrase